MGLVYRLPFPDAGLPVVAGDTALDHFVAPMVACDDEAGEVAAAEAKCPERNHNENLEKNLNKYELTPLML